jgi:putative SOS response-associated peptidase YedK
VTNIRNVGSSHWRRWLGTESRCLVPFTSFTDSDNGTYCGRTPVRLFGEKPSTTLLSA